MAGWFPAGGVGGAKAAERLVVPPPPGLGCGAVRGAEAVALTGVKALPGAGGRAARGEGAGGQACRRAQLGAVSRGSSACCRAAAPCGRRGQRGLAVRLGLRRARLPAPLTSGCGGRPGGGALSTQRRAAAESGALGPGWREGVVSFSDLLQGVQKSAGLGLGLRRWQAWYAGAGSGSGSLCRAGESVSSVPISCSSRGFVAEASSLPTFSGIAENCLSSGLCGEGARTSHCCLGEGGREADCFSLAKMPDNLCQTFSSFKCRILESQFLDFLLPAHFS